MSIAFVRRTEGAVESDTITLNIQSSGNDRCLVVGLAHKKNNPIVPDSVVFNGSENFSLVKIGEIQGKAQTVIYVLIAPSIITADVVITMPTGSLKMTAYVALFTGVDQTDPFVTANVTSAKATSDAPSVNVTSASDEVVVDVMSHVFDGPENINSNSSPNVKLMDVAAIGSNKDVRGGGQWEVGAAVSIYTLL